MSEPEVFTWGDVEFLRREAARHERWARRGDGTAGSIRKAERLRSLADRIERSLRGEAA